MKFNLIKTIAVFFLFCVNVSNAQVGIGVPAENIHPSAELEVKSNTKGFLPPRMTQAERDAILKPAAGLLIYQTDGDVSGLYYFDGKDWKNGLGVQGIKGDKGETGAVGAQGPKGEPGTSTSGAEILVSSTAVNSPRYLSFTPTSTTGNTSLFSNASLSFNPGTGNLSSPSFTGDLRGTASNALKVSTSDNSSSTSIFYPSFAPVSSTSSSSSLFVDNGLSFLPATNTLSTTNVNATTFTGSLNGNASSADQVAVTPSVSVNTRYLSFSPSTSGVSDLQTNNALTFVPSTGNLSATTFTGNVTGNVAGNASSASKVSTVADFSNAVDNFITFTRSSSTSSGQQLCNDIALKYCPGTGTLSATNVNATNFTGSLQGNVRGDLTGNVTGTTLKGRNFIQLNPSIVASTSPTSDNIVTAGYISATGSITLPTAAAIASSIGGSIGKGTSVEFTVENSSTGDATFLLLGTGMSVQTSPTIAGTNSLVVSQANAIGRFRLVFTSATTAMLFRVY